MFILITFKSQSTGSKVLTMCDSRFDMEIERVKVACDCTDLLGIFTVPFGSKHLFFKVNFISFLENIMSPNW